MIKIKLTHTIASFCIFFFLFSCSKREEEQNIFSAVIAQNFTDPLKNEDNIQVEDYIPYTITIVDNKTDENVEYRLVAIREGQAYHQTIWKDFGLFLNTDAGVLNKEKKYISFTKKGKHKFYIQPFVPGTFMHIYELQKWVNGIQEGESFKLNLKFSAVKIETGEVYDGIERKPDGSTSFTWCSRFFIIYDGEDEGDNYLSNPDIYQYCESTVGDVKNTFIFFKEGEQCRVTSCWVPKDVDIIDRIRIVQKVGDLPEYVIEYHNVKFNNNNKLK